MHACPNKESWQIIVYVIIHDCSPTPSSHNPSLEEKGKKLGRFSHELGAQESSEGVLGRFGGGFFSIYTRFIYSQLHRERALHSLSYMQTEVLIL